MTIFDKKDLTQKDIDQLNSLLCQAEFNTLRKATKKILGDGVEEKEVEKKFKALRKKLNKYGYTKNTESNIYENKKVKIDEDKNLKQEILVSKNEEIKTQTQEEKTDKKQRRTKKEIEAERIKKKREEDIEINPVRFISSTGQEIYNTLIETQNDDVVWTGAYLMNEVSETFKLVECGCQLIDTYKLIDASIQMVYHHRVYLKRHHFNQDFYELKAKNKINGSKKKQVHLELSETAARYLEDMSKDDFAMFNKSELINYCMFVVTKSAQNSCFKEVKIFDMKERKQKRLAKKITGRKKTTKKED